MGIEYRKLSATGTGDPNQEAFRMANDAATLRIVVSDRGVTGLECTGSLRQQARALRLGTLIMPALALLDATLAGGSATDSARASQKAAASS
jgi:hypothetical protein